MPLELIIFILVSVVAVLILISPPETGQKYAGFWIRLASIFVDGAFLSLIFAGMLTVITELIYPFISSMAYLEFCCSTRKNRPCTTCLPGHSSLGPRSPDDWIG